MKKEEKLKALEQLENNNVQENNVVNKPTSDYIKIEKHTLPFNGILYPESWEIAYRCPTADEIGDFSTINEDDQARIINAIADLVRKCYIIYDVENKKQISSEELNDGEKMFFFLKLRELYLGDSAPIEYLALNQTYNETVKISFTSDMLEFPVLKDKLVESFDGRCFDLTMPTTNNNIKFHIPTIKISQKIFKYISGVYKDIEATNNGQKTKQSKSKQDIDKKFLFILPYLFETGDEKIESLQLKFKKIKQNNNGIYDDYLAIANSLNLTNFEKITYQYKESEEEALIKFPMGWRKIFVNTRGLEELF